MYKYWCQNNINLVCDQSKSHFSIHYSTLLVIYFTPFSSLFISCLCQLCRIAVEWLLCRFITSTQCLYVILCEIYPLHTSSYIKMKIVQVQKQCTWMCTGIIHTSAALIVFESLHSLYLCFYKYRYDKVNP